MRVVLFDMRVTGHHLNYVEFLASFLIERGDHVTLATWSKHPRVDALRDRLPALDAWFATEGDGPFGGGLARRTVRMAWAVRRALRECGEIDVLHHLDVDGSEPSLLLALAVRPLPSVFGTAFNYPVSKHAPLGQRLRALLRRAALRRLLATGRMQGLFVHSERIRAAQLEYLGSEAVDRVFAAPDPVAAPESISRQEARLRLDLPQDVPLLLFFGGLRPGKGPDVFLDALPLVGADAGAWVAVFAGQPEGVDAGDVERCRARLTGPGSVIARLGFVAEADIDAYFAAADAVVLPYRRSFAGTSGLLRRAAAAGKPVIASDVGDVGPTVREHRLGLLVPPESPTALARAVEHVLAHRAELGRTVQRRGPAYAAASDWRILGERVRARYAESLGKAAGG